MGLFSASTRPRAEGTLELQPGIQIARPLIPEEQYQNLTDHLPVVLLRNAGTRSFS